jgi:hypothetical protein
MAPESWLTANDKYVSWDIPQISEGSEPVKLLEPKFRAITSPDTEQVTPVHTGEEHLLATLAQVQAGILDWMLVELMRDSHQISITDGEDVMIQCAHINIIAELSAQKGRRHIWQTWLSLPTAS